jgi:hypothetical protein
MRILRRFAALSAALLAALAVAPVFAQTTADGGSPDLVPVAVWTLVAVIIALGVVAVGYLYRRERGLNRPLKMPPIPADALAAQMGLDPPHGAAGQPLSEHVVVEHAAAGHDDATEQAALLHGQH